MKLLWCIIFLLSTTAVMTQTMGVMTYNIRYATERDGENQWDNRKEKVVQLLEYYAPAVFGIQEGLLHQVDYIDEAMANYAYVGVGRDDGKQKGEFSALFFDTTQLTLLESNTFWLSETPDEITVGWDAAMERICTYAKFKWNNQDEEFWVFNTHFDHIGAEARLQSARLILERISTLNEAKLPLVLMGDLNAEPDSDPITTISRTMDDGASISQKAPYGPDGTFSGFDKLPALDRRIDYVFTKKIQVLSYTHIDDRYTNNRFVSDHLPVWAIIEFLE